MYKRIYSIWHNMKSRCLNKHTEKYMYYGGRGISVCNEWKNCFKSFYIWAIENGYNDNLTLDRINIDGNYEPSNCRWVDTYVQNNNTRKNNYITYNGETKSVSEWARQYKLDRNVLNMRLRRGWTFERAVNSTVRQFFHVKR